MATEPTSFWGAQARKEAREMRFSELLEAFTRASGGEYENDFLRRLYADELDHRWNRIKKEEP